MGDLLPIIAILVTVGLPIATGLVLGAISMKNKHSERMGLINQGIIPPDTTPRKANPNRMVSLRNGIVLISIGIGLAVGFLTGKYVFLADDDLMFWVLGSSVVLFLGLGYLTYFYVTRNMPEMQERDVVE